MSISWNLSSFLALAGLFAVFPCIWDVAARAGDGQPQTGTRFIHKTEDTVCTFPFCDISPHFPAAGLTLNFYFIFSSHFTELFWVCIDPNGRVGTSLWLKAIKMVDSLHAVPFFCFVKCLLSFQCLLSSSGSHRPADSSFVVVRSKNVAKWELFKYHQKWNHLLLFAGLQLFISLPLFKSPLRGCILCISISVAQRLVLSVWSLCLTALASPGSLLEMHSPRLLNENLYYNNTPGDS